ncbi:MAG: hypothetical protein NWE93_08170 [Candidatus Bathyarchaeota archaeon]|nr:hypothetical protein [Candidatus Bathyarchaeota archaeon]
MKKLSSRIRGWFPEEPTLPTRLKPLGHVPYMAWWLAGGIAGGAGALGLMVVFGNLTGITGESAAAFLWYIETASFAWCVGAAIAVYGYLRHRRSHGEGSYEGK